MSPKLTQLLTIVFLAGCAAKPLVPGGQSVILSKESPPSECAFVAEVQGSQGNFWTAEFTSDIDLINGARNELRNAAFMLQADYVKIETESFSHNTSDDSLGGTYSAVVIGNAYRCNSTSASRATESLPGLAAFDIQSHVVHGRLKHGPIGPGAHANH